MTFRKSVDFYSSLLFLIYFCLSILRSLLQKIYSISMQWRFPEHYITQVVQKASLEKLVQVTKQVREHDWQITDEL